MERYGRYVAWRGLLCLLWIDVGKQLTLLMQSHNQKFNGPTFAKKLEMEMKPHDHIHCVYTI